MIGKLDAIQSIKFWQHEQNGTLTVFAGEDSNSVPFPIARIFSITGVSTGGRRGNHAHRACTQLLVCLKGSVEVHSDDGLATAKCILKSDGIGLLIPPMIWNTEVFEDPATVLMVICDHPYDPSEYIRDWDEYVRMNHGA